ncbi:MAG: hypothetical protein WC551_08450 [Patescibacteria group bacterium]
MKKIILAAAMIATLLISLSAKADDCLPRDRVITFRASLLDETGMPYDGAADVEVSIYDVPSHSSAPLYREGFEDVVVSKGWLGLPILAGVVLEGSPNAVVDNSNDELYVDVAVNGILMIELQPIGTHLKAIRAEEADIAYGLKEDIKLTSADIPAHSADKVTSGIIDPARLPSGIPAPSFSSGTVGLDQVPLIPALKIADGVFPETAIPDVLDAGIFSTGTLREEVLPGDIILRNNIYVSAGTIGHLGVIPVPMGFSRDYCQWVVGIHDLPGSGGVDQFQVYTDQNGVVSCRWSPDQADSELNHYCTASYMLVCLR